VKLLFAGLERIRNQKSEIRSSSKELQGLDVDRRKKERKKEREITLMDCFQIDLKKSYGMDFLL
jgi:hypothetical protein